MPQLFVPVVLAFNALEPIAQLFDPVVLDVNVLCPTAVLSLSVYTF